jgi:hypothetical protein
MADSADCASSATQQNHSRKFVREPVVPEHTECQQKEIAMHNANQIFKYISRVVAVMVMALAVNALFPGAVPAAQPKPNVNFNHLKTGFPLTGAHTTVPCETCHVQGAFKGTPKQCATCHTPGSRVQTSTVKPGKHIPTNQPCEQCHSSTATWSVARFSHMGVIVHQCAQCHNNSIAKGKPANHPLTNEPCDTCHRTTTWMSVGFSHVGVLPNTCATCHGISASGKPANHIPTSVSCDACHTTGGTFTTSRFTHSVTQGILPNQCSTCHNGSYTHANALGKTPSHPATTASCDMCHKNYTSFTGATFSHTGIAPGTCSTCHFQGGSGLGKPTNHIPYESQLLAGASMNCDACHTSTTSFTVQRMNHNNSLGNGAGWCKGCHQTGTNYPGGMEKKSLTHYERYAGQTDCSSSGCHRPLGNQGSAYSRWTN